MNVRCANPTVMRCTVEVPEECGRGVLAQHLHKQVRVAGLKVGGIPMPIAPIDCQIEPRGLRRSMAEQDLQCPGEAELPGNPCWLTWGTDVLGGKLPGML